jgi:predicted RNA-binding Zn ribbon-like protein
VIFTHDTEVALAAAAALVNTDRDEPQVDYLPTVEALAEFVRTWGWTGVMRGDAAELAGVRRLRPRLAGLWAADEDAVAALVNRLLRDGHALPQLVRHDQWGYHVHATSPDARLADRMAVEAAMAVSDVIRLGELGRLRVCAADNCERVLVDLSKNRSKRYCDAVCGNRTNVAAYRARRA